jgi:hypothetical protein
MPAVAQDRDPVRQYQRFLQRVRNKHDRHAATLEVAHEVEEILFLLRRQRRRGLVEDDDLGLVQDGARDFDHLLLGGAEQADGRGRRDVEIQRLQELLGGDVDAAQPVVESLLSQEQVLGDRHGRNQAVFLKHHRNPEMARFQGSPRRRLNAVDLHRARGEGDDAGHHLGQRRLAGSVLADEGVNLAAAKFEIDILDRGNAGIEFCGRAKREDDVAHARNSSSIMVSGRRNRRPGPLAMANSAPFISTAATTP